MGITKTGYFVLPATDHKGFKATIMSSEAFQVVRNKKKVIKKVKGKVDKIKVGEVVPIPDTEDTEEVMVPALTIQGKELATLKDGRKIVHAIIPRWVKKRTKAFLDPNVVDTDDPLEDRQATYLGIKSKFIGYTREDVFKKFPELEGYDIVEGFDGEQVKVSRLKKHVWAGEI